MCFDLFGGKAKMLFAVDNTKGKEFNVGEVFESFSDIPVREMCRIADRYDLLGPGLPLLKMSEQRKRRMAEYLRGHTHASDVQIGRFLHLDM